MLPLEREREKTCKLIKIVLKKKMKNAIYYLRIDI
jgi:hypothetical protein